MSNEESCERHSQVMVGGEESSELHTPVVMMSNEESTERHSPVMVGCEKSSELHPFLLYSSQNLVWLHWIHNCRFLKHTTIQMVLSETIL